MFTTSRCCRLVTDKRIASRMIEIPEKKREVVSAVNYSRLYMSSHRQTIARKEWDVDDLAIISHSMCMLTLTSPRRRSKSDTVINQHKRWDWHTRNILCFVFYDGYPLLIIFRIFHQELFANKTTAAAIPFFLPFRWVNSAI